MVHCGMEISDPAHIDRVRIDGYTVLPSVFDAALLAEINADPGASRPFASVLENPALLAVVRALLGDAPVVGWLWHSPGLPATHLPENEAERHPVHSDSPWLFPEAQIGLPVFGVAVSVPLVSDNDIQSGATRLWSGGTHLALSPVDVERMAESMPFVQPVLRVGDVLLRDLRTWHGYAPNLSGKPCPSLTAVYTRPWYRLTVVPPPKLSRARFDALTDDMKSLLRYAIITDTD